MSLSGSEAGEEPVCHCRQVTAAQLRAAIEAGELRSVAEVALATGATTGCGCCRLDVEQLMRDCGIEPTDAW